MTQMVLTCPEGSDWTYNAPGTGLNQWTCVGPSGLYVFEQVPYEAASPFTMTISEAESVAASIFVVWAIAWGARQVIRVIRR